MRGIRFLMKNKLQYLYSILVLSGVLASSYLMIEQRPGSSPAARPQQSMTFRSEAALAAPGLDQLLQFESQMLSLEEKVSAKQKRQLSESKKNKRSQSLSR